VVVGDPIAVLPVLFHLEDFPEVVAPFSRDDHRGRNG
jgi:hypothetical protein